MDQHRREEWCGFYSLYRSSLERVTGTTEAKNYIFCGLPLSEYHLYISYSYIFGDQSVGCRMVTKCGST